MYTPTFILVLPNPVYLVNMKCLNPRVSRTWSYARWISWVYPCFQSQGYHLQGLLQLLHSTIPRHLQSIVISSKSITTLFELRLGIKTVSSIRPSSIANAFSHARFYSEANAWSSYPKTPRIYSTTTQTGLKTPSSSRLSITSIPIGDLSKLLLEEPCYTSRITTLYINSTTPLFIQYLRVQSLSAWMIRQPLLSGSNDYKTWVCIPVHDLVTFDQTTYMNTYRSVPMFKYFRISGFHNKTIVCSLNFGGNFVSEFNGCGSALMSLFCICELNWV